MVEVMVERLKQVVVVKVVGVVKVHQQLGHLRSHSSPYNRGSYGC
jgi:hypothetical protein